MNTRHRALAAALLAATTIVGACARTPAPAASVAPAALPAPLAAARQLVVVTTPTWDATTGTLRRYVRDGAAWREEGAALPVVVGRAGVAWSDDVADAVAAGANEPRKREGDGRSPAGVFPLDTVFGFAPAASVPWVRLPYVALQPGSECVDDGRSAHYNTVVDRAALGAVDWTSAERMREIAQYRFGVIVGYNAAPPRAGRGSCIFLHIWAGPTSTTAGCTAFDAAALEALIRWLDPARRPALVQLPTSAYARLRGRWGLP